MCDGALLLLLIIKTYKYAISPFLIYGTVHRPNLQLSSLPEYSALRAQFVHFVHIQEVVCFRAAITAISYRDLDLDSKIPKLSQHQTLICANPQVDWS